MKKIALCVAAVMLSAGLCGCGDSDRVRNIADAAPVQVKAPSTVKQGYGQGVQLDDKNRPVGALDFNKRYGSFDAEAIGEGKQIRLTFDQGYENGFTEKILDILKEKKVQAVFFLVQDYAERNPDLVRRMIADGHIIGNHSVSHRSMPTLSAEECAREITGLNDYLDEHFGVRPTLFRPPMGEFSELSLAVTKQCGCKTVLWSYAYRDWLTDEQPDPAEAMAKLTGAAHDGAIYLLHSVSQTNAEVLGDFIDKLRADGYEFYALKG